jgi:hypothetical protein
MVADPAAMLVMASMELRRTMAVPSGVWSNDVTDVSQTDFSLSDM